MLRAVAAGLLVALVATSLPTTALAARHRPLVGLKRAAPATQDHRGAAGAAGRRLALGATRGEPARQTKAARQALVAKGVGRAKAAGKPKVRFARTRATIEGSTKGGLAHLGHAIRHNPITFVGGFIAMGALGAVLNLVGLPSEGLVLGLSGAALAAQIGITVPEFKSVKGVERFRLVGSHIVFPTLVFLASTFLGHEISHMIPHAEGGLDTARAFVNGAIVAADVPMVGLTAWETFREMRSMRRQDQLSTPRPGSKPAAN